MTTTFLRDLVGRTVRFRYPVPGRFASYEEATVTDAQSLSIYRTTVSVESEDGRTCFGLILWEDVSLIPLPLPLHW